MPEWDAVFLRTWRVISTLIKRTSTEGSSWAQCSFDLRRTEMRFSINICLLMAVQIISHSSLHMCIPLLSQRPFTLIHSFIHSFIAFTLHSFNVSTNHRYIKVGIYTEHRIWHSHDMLISSLSQWEVEVEVGMVVALLQASNAAVRRPTTGRLRGEISSHLSIDKTRCLVKFLWRPGRLVTLSQTTMFSWPYACLCLNLSRP